MDLEQAGRFVTHLRLVGIEATYGLWGKSKSWVAINIGGIDFLWNPAGEYDGWDRSVGDMSAQAFGKFVDEATRHGRGQKPDTEASDG